MPARKTCGVSAKGHPAPEKRDGEQRNLFLNDRNQQERKRCAYRSWREFRKNDLYHRGDKELFIKEDAFWADPEG